MACGSLETVQSAVGVSDMCLLEPLQEDNFIDNLRQRFASDQIYVSSMHAALAVALRGTSKLRHKFLLIKSVYSRSGCPVCPLLSARV